MFHIVLFILVVILTILDLVILAGILGAPFIGDLVQENTAALVAFVCVQLPILFYLIYHSYIIPIEKLKQGIARFHTGLDNSPNIEVHSFSRGMNEIIVFFQKSLKILSVFREEITAWRQLRSEVEIASEIQKQTLTQDSRHLDGLDIAVATCAASEVGGDSVDVVKGVDGNFYLYVGDVTGHGVASWFVMMVVNALISAFSLKSSSGAEILAETNAILKPRIKQNMMMTAVMLRWDSVNKKMYYTGAGHEFILVYKAKDRQVYKIKTGWVALGMVKNISKALKEQQILFEKWDIIVLYTDGISEARYRSEQNGMLFGVDRITQAIQKIQIPTPESVFRQITLDLSAFMWYKYVQYDDITLAVVWFTPDGQDSKILFDIQNRIDSNHLTEWNWWIRK